MPYHPEVGDKVKYMHRGQSAGELHDLPDLNKVYTVSATEYAIRGTYGHRRANWRLKLAEVDTSGLSEEWFRASDFNLVEQVEQVDDFSAAWNRAFKGM